MRSGAELPPHTPNFSPVPKIRALAVFMPEITGQVHEEVRINQGGTVHLKTAKVVNFVLCVFYHNKNILINKPKGNLKLIYTKLILIEVLILNLKVTLEIILSYINYI